MLPGQRPPHQASKAARTAAVAQRVIEETLSLERRTEVAPTVLDDDALVWISRLINQDVNVYDGPQLLATSERDLFASGQLPTRTPDAVYRAIAIDRLPAAKDNIRIEFSDAATEDVTGGQCIAGGTSAVGNQNRPVSSAIQSMPKNFGRGG